MKRTLFLLALIVISAVPVLAQETNQFGILIGGSRRFVEGGGSGDDEVRSIFDDERDWIESNFSLSNTSFELYWSIPIEPELNLKFKGGRAETEIAIPYFADDPRTPDKTDDIRKFRRDVTDGQVAHVEALVEYEFDEPFGSSGLYAGLGYYRLSAPDEESRTTWGLTAGVTADFPITRRYGVVADAAYHWIRTDFDPRLLTVSGGLRVSF
jgi:hypothetical protein